MKAFLLLIITCAVLALPQPPTQDIRWRTSWADAALEARLEKKPLFVVFRCER